ncbi:MAG: hypothetical protein L6Q84_08605 [Polyangiaceae bacterium]|nr:hypothetical protein [Polyangiaceae bacterium]
MLPFRASALWAASCVLLACALEEDGAAPGAGKTVQGGTAGVSGAPFGGSGGGGGWAGSLGGAPSDAAGDQDAAGDADDAMDAIDAPADSPEADATDGAPAWNPATSPDCVVWLDAADPSTLKSAGPYVDSWASKCGAALATASGTKRPLLTLNNGRPAVHCDGLDDALVFGQSAKLADQYSILFVVYKHPGAATQQVLLSNRSVLPPVGATSTWWGTLGGTLLVYQGTATPTPVLQGAPMPDGNPMLLELAVSTMGDRALYRNGVFEQSLTGSSGLATLLGAGHLCHDPLNVEHGAFGVSEFVVFSHRLTALERAEATNALKKKWAL